MAKHEDEVGSQYLQRLKYFLSIVWHTWHLVVRQLVEQDPSACKDFKSEHYVIDKVTKVKLEMS